MVGFTASGLKLQWAERGVAVAAGGVLCAAVRGRLSVACCFMKFAMLLVAAEEAGNVDRHCMSSMEAMRSHIVSGVMPMRCGPVRQTRIVKRPLCTRVSSSEAPNSGWLGAYLTDLVLLCIIE